MGDSIAAGMAQYYRPEYAAPAVGFLAHREVPISGEMFVIGGDHMRRVFVGVGQGHRADSGELSMERIRDNFATVMSTQGHIVAQNTLDKVMLDPRVPWEDGVDTVF